MAGCFAVTFQYADQQVISDDYPRSPPKVSKAVEWVSVEQDTAKRVVLQHVLVSGPAMIKHWRQDWRREGTLRVDYRGQDRLSLRHEPATAGAWTQVVTNVDDAPRAACEGTWEHAGGESTWSCRVDTALPRREKSRRHAYDLLQRTNIHRVHAGGWDHDQDNRKVRLDGAARQLVARELGHNLYERIDEAHCEEALAWWPAQRGAWIPIQRAWEEQLGALPAEGERVVTLDEDRGLLPLWVELFWVASRSTRRDRGPDQVQERAARHIRRHLRDPASAAAGPAAPVQVAVTAPLGS
jgi:hypothetical protein